MAPVFKEASSTLTEEQKRHVSSMTTPTPDFNIYPDWMLGWLKRLSEESKQADKDEDNDDPRCVLDISLPPPLPLHKLMPTLHKLMPILQSTEFPPDFDEPERDDLVEHEQPLCIVRTDTLDDKLYTTWVPRPSCALFAAFQRVHKLYVHDGDVFTHQGEELKSTDPLNPLANDLNNWLSDQKFPRVPYDGQCPLLPQEVHFDFLL